MNSKTADSQRVDGFTVKIDSRGRRSHDVKFGSVTISGSKPSHESVQANIDLSSEALQRISKKFQKPGVRLSPKKGVPRYFLDENDPELFVRVLNGSTERGRLVDGRFVVLE